MTATSILLILLSVLAFAFSLWRIWKSDWKGASVAGALFAVALGFSNTNLASISFGAMNATFRNVQESQEVLEKIRRLSVANAMFANQVVAHLGQWGGISDAQKQAILDDIAKATSDIETTPQQKREMFRPMLQVAATNLGELYHAHVLGGFEATGADGKTAWEKKWQTTFYPAIQDPTGILDLENLFNQLLPEILLTSESKHAFWKMTKDLGNAFKDSRDRLRLSNSYFTTMDNYRASDTLAEAYRKLIKK